MWALTVRALHVLPFCTLHFCVLVCHRAQAESELLLFLTVGVSVATLGLL